MLEREKIIEEPRIESFLGWISKEDGVENIKNDINKLSNTLYFFNKDQVLSLYEKIKYVNNDKINNDEYKIILKNLMQLYPLSSPIVMEILKGSIQETEEVLKMYDVGNSLVNSWNILLRNISQQSVKIPAIINSYEEKIQKYEEIKAKFMEDINSLKKTKSKHNQLYNEVENLKKEYKEIEESYKKESLDKLKAELEIKIGEKKKLYEELNESKKTIKEIEQDLKNIKSENNAYKKSLKALSEITKILPDSEGE